MVPINQVAEGLSQYMDAQLMPKLPRNSLYRIVIGTGVAIAIRKAETSLDALKSNPIINTLGIIDDANNIDIDIIIDEAKNYIPPEGYRIRIDKAGNMDLIIMPGDLDELRRYIDREVRL